MLQYGALPTSYQDPDPENDLKEQNLGLSSAPHRVYDREQWREIVETATLLQGHGTR